MPNEAEHPDGEMVCRHCGYSLVGLASRECPECGEPFDPHDPTTFGLVVEGRIHYSWIFVLITAPIWLLVLYEFIPFVWRLLWRLLHEG